MKDLAPDFSPPSHSDAEEDPASDLCVSVPLWFNLDCS